MSSVPKHSITLPRAKLRRIARAIVDERPEVNEESRSDQPIKVVCISDTHNHQPEIPPGDLLLHAGDLTEWGSFDEVQKQLSWLSSQPHKHKVLIAGNHDILFDPNFLASHKERFPTEPGRIAAELDFGSVLYLNSSTVTLEFPDQQRLCTLYGSPWTPRYVDSAFQYAQDDALFWAGRIPPHIDILLTHGPPYGHLDGVRRAGCPYLADAVAETRPRLVVCGHIHVGYGREMVVFDRLRRWWEDIERGWSGWEVVPGMVVVLVCARIMAAVSALVGRRGTSRRTELINAAVVGKDGRLANPAVVTYI